MLFCVIQEISIKLVLIFFILRMALICLCKRTIQMLLLLNICLTIFVNSKYICCSSTFVLSALRHINSKLLIKCVGGNCSHECGRKKADNGDRQNHGGGFFTSIFFPGYFSCFSFCKENIILLNHANMSYVMMYVSF